MLRILRSKLHFCKSTHRNRRSTIMVAWNADFFMKYPNEFSDQARLPPPQFVVPVQINVLDKCLPRSGESWSTHSISFAIWTVCFRQEVIRAPEIDLARLTFHASEMRVLDGTYSAGLSNRNRRTTRGDYPEINCSIVHARERCSTSAQFYRERLFYRAARCALSSERKHGAR